ncbi:proline-rich receptor-like protein kinase PERK9 [Penaeus monodon]|uniref:proline-rich receptor-like protein kinase PERK9 n=1 Tax=Penaeus monodon TaxID=6687 RepID=UPI0018A74E45|nr:proline-rich receptor-like protein kinase PERK9 [Penaeus monodon]
MARLALWLVSVVVIGVAVPEVNGGKIIFPESEEVAADAQVHVDDESLHSESRGLWESDLYFLQKLSSLFSGKDEKRETPGRPSRFRPEPLPLQFFDNRRVGTDTRRRPAQGAVRQKFRVPSPPSSVIAPPRPGSPQVPLGSPAAFGQPSRPSPSAGIPLRQNVLAIHPQQQQRPVFTLPKQDVPPAPDAFPQPSQNHVIRLKPTFTSPLPRPTLPSQVGVSQAAPEGSFPYQFVKPGSPVVSTTSRPLAAPSARPQKVDSFSKPLKQKKPTLLGSLAELTGGFLGGTRRTQQNHPRPMPQPQRVIIPPQQKPTQKKTVLEDTFNPSPPEGSPLVDAFQPMFVASPSVDHLGKDAMKPMKIAEKRTATTTTTSQPELVDFF